MGNLIKLNKIKKNSHILKETLFLITSTAANIFQLLNDVENTGKFCHYDWNSET